MDAEYSLKMDREAAMRKPCKNKSPEVGIYGECLRCGADQGEACLPMKFE
jgi:hypothetical protein